MFSQEEKVMLNVNRAVIDLHGFFIITESNKIINNPKILVTLLTEKELTAFVGLPSLTPYEKLTVEEAAVKHAVNQIIGHTEETISLDYSPTGIITYIAEGIFSKSGQYLEYPEHMYNEAAASVSFLESMVAIVSYYTNTPYHTVKDYPVNQIFKQYAICQSAFPSQIQPISKTTEE